MPQVKRTWALGIALAALLLTLFYVLRREDPAAPTYKIVPGKHAGEVPQEGNPGNQGEPR